jgi:tetratricopeptide (TPR) repeat protein
MPPMAWTAAVVLAAVLAYAGALWGGFVLDDYILIVDNEALRSGASVPRYFSRGMWPESDLGAPDTALFRPLVLLTFFAVYQLAGLAPLAFHAVSVILHAVNAGLVLQLLRRLGGGADGAAVVGALVFALHPVHVESVAWISGVGDLLATACVVLAVWWYSHPSGRAYGAALVCAALALLSKEIGVAVPALALGCDWLRGHRVRWARIGGLVALVIVYLAVRRAALGAVLNTPLVSMGAVLVAVDYALGYVSMAVVPTQLGLFLRPPEQVLGVAAGVVAAVTIAGAVVWARRDRAVAFAVLWFAVALAPALALVFNVGGTYAQRFLYLPSVAVALIATRAAMPVLARSRGAIAVAAVLAALGTATAVASREWQDGGAVLARAIRNTPAYAGAYWALGHHHERTGQVDAAARWYLEAARLWPPGQRAFAYSSLGRLYLAAGDTERSLAFHTRELEASPRPAAALVAIGNVHARRGDFARAARAFEAAWTDDGARWEALYNLGVALTFLGRDEEARRHFSRFSSGAPPGRFAMALADARRRLEPESAASGVPAAAAPEPGSSRPGGLTPGEASNR